VDLTSDLSATLLVNAGLPIIRLFSLWGSLIPRTTFAGGRIAIQYANRGGMIIRYWAVRIRQNKWAKGIFAAGTTIIYRLQIFELEKGTEKRVRSVVMKAIRIKVSSRISPERLRNVPIIAATLRGGISYRWSWSPTGTQDEQETRRPSLIEKIFISSDVFMRLTAVFAGYIQGYILSLQKGLFSFSPIRPHS